MKKLKKILVAEHEGQQFKNTEAERVIIENGLLIGDQRKTVEFTIDPKTHEMKVVMTDHATGRELKFGMNDMHRLHLHHDDSIYIEWGVEDFESRATEHEEDEEMEIGSVYDRSKFLEALKAMEASHDAGLGITWGEIDYYLDELCLLPITQKAETEN